MTTSKRDSTPPFLITPTGWDFCLLGDAGLEPDLDLVLPLVKNGLASKAPVDDLDLNPPRDCSDFFVGDTTSDTLPKPDMIEGVIGVLASDLERTRLDGVFGGILNCGRRGSTPRDSSARRPRGLG